MCTYPIANVYLVPARRRKIRRGLLLFLSATAINALPAAAQVPARSHIRGRVARVPVTNTSPSLVTVQMAVWEATPTDTIPLLTAPARVKVFPSEFQLESGQRQVVRLFMDEGAYDEGAQLSLESVFDPLDDRMDVEGTATNDSSVRIVMKQRLRLLTVVEVHP